MHDLVRTRVFTALSILALALAVQSCGDDNRSYISSGEKNSWPSLSGPYLGMELKGKEAELFAPGILSHGFHEISMTFSPDLDEFCLITTNRAYAFYVVVHSKMEGGVWAQPEVVGFSGGHYRDTSISFKPDGSGVLISSDRPGDYIFDIWDVERSGVGWKRPVSLGVDIPGFKGGTCAVQTRQGDIFYQSLDDDIYVARKKGDGFSTPERLPEPISTIDHEGRPWIAPDGSYLLFNSNRAGGFGESDIYVCFARSTGWSEPVNLGARVNSTSGDFAASVTPDGKYIFFSSYRVYEQEDYAGRSYGELIDMFASPLNGYAALYWADASIIDALKDGI